MVQQCSRRFAWNDEGQVVSRRTGRVYYDRVGQQGLTHVHGANSHAIKAAAAWGVTTVDLMLWSSQPLCSELPADILDYVAADPNTALARHFRFYVRKALLPDMLRVQELLSAHGRVVQLPPTAFLQNKVCQSWQGARHLPLLRHVWIARSW
eukprot:SAG31_NODE_590_length_13794_cov_22.123695_8_plen_152_part_00